MQRETKSFKTPQGIEIVMKTWLSAREYNEVKAEMFKAIKIDPTTGEKSDSMTGEFMLAQEQKLLSALIVSIDGSTEKISDKLLDMRNDEYQFIVAEANRINSANLAPAK